MTKPLPKPHQWSMQEVYTVVVNHLQVQGSRAALKDGQCVYRDNNNVDNKSSVMASCAVGCLIPKVNYDPAFENGSLNRRPQIFEMLRQRGLPDGAERMLLELQLAHDGKQYWEDKINPRSGLPQGVTKALRQIAKKFKVEPLF